MSVGIPLDPAEARYDRYAVRPWNASAVVGTPLSGASIVWRAERSSWQSASVGLSAPEECGWDPTSSRLHKDCLRGTPELRFQSRFDGGRHSGLGQPVRQELEAFCSTLLAWLEAL